LAGVVTIPCLLTGCLIFRYYNVKAAKRRFFLIASVGSAIAVSLCYAWFTLPQSRRLEVGNVFFVTLVSLMVLWVKVKFDFPAFPRTKGRCQR
jgi:bacteriorhodopsin